MCVLPLMCVWSLICVCVADMCFVRCNTVCVMHTIIVFFSQVLDVLVFALLVSCNVFLPEQCRVSYLPWHGGGGGGYFSW